MPIVTTICKFSPRSHNSGTSLNFAWMILHLLGFIAPFPPVSLLHQCGRGFRKAQPSEAHLLCEKQPEQRGGGPRANGEAVPPHRPQVLKWERFRLTKATSEDTVNGDRVCASRLPPVSETVWRGLLQDLLDMQQNVYTCLKPQVCHQVNWTHRWLWDSFSGHFAVFWFDGIFFCCTTSNQHWEQSSVWYSVFIQVYLWGFKLQKESPTFRHAGTV